MKLVVADNPNTIRRHFMTRVVEAAQAWYKRMELINEEGQREIFACAKRVEDCLQFHGRPIENVQYLEHIKPEVRQYLERLVGGSKPMRRGKR